MASAGPIVDFDAAYHNSAVIHGAPGYPPCWAERAVRFRERLAADGRLAADLAYGPGARNRFDLFLPEGMPAGLVVFVHGGYWMAFDKSSWSHLAEGALARGHAVAMPSYPLCPAIRIGGIAREIGAFLDAAAARVAGPIALCGHSAGGHLAARLACAGSPIAPNTRERIASVVPISGLHDLRPLRRTAMNATLGLDAAEAAAESPAFLDPGTDAPILAYVGAEELPEFRRQSALLASAWHGLGARIEVFEAPGRHHFDVVDDLADPASPLVAALTGPAGR